MSAVRDLFNQIAPVYDRINGIMSWGRHRAWKQIAVDWATPEQFSTGQVADLCCGTGDGAKLWAKRTPATVIWGIDFAEGMLHVARRHPDQKIHWLQADILALPLEAAVLDGATLCFGLRNVSAIPTCLTELRRVLRPGSRAVILDLCLRRDDGFQRWYLEFLIPQLGAWLGHKDPYAYLAPSLERFPPPEELANLALAAGFQSAHQRTLEGGGILFLILTA